MGGKETPFGVVFAHSVFSFGFLEKLLELFLLVLPIEQSLNYKISLEAFFLSFFALRIHMKGI
jgi:hypothetical protein